jgi:hypothetical protein
MHEARWAREQARIEAADAVVDAQIARLVERLPAIDRFAGPHPQRAREVRTKFQSRFQGWGGAPVSSSKWTTMRLVMLHPWTVG